VIVYTIVGDRSSLAHVLGDAVDMFVRRETPSASSTMYATTSPNWQAVRGSRRARRHQRGAVLER
jgi:hypothetical protein